MDAGNGFRALVGLLRGVVLAKRRPSPGSITVSWGEVGPVELDIRLSKGSPRRIEGLPLEALESECRQHRWPLPPDPQEGG